MTAQIDFFAITSPGRWGALRYISETERLVAKDRSMTPRKADGTSHACELRLTEEAAEWVLSFTAERLGKDELYSDPLERNAAFRRWYSRSPRHLRAFLEIYALHHIDGVLGAPAVATPRPSVAPLSNAGARLSRRKTLRHFLGHLGVTAARALRTFLRPVVEALPLGTSRLLRCLMLAIVASSAYAGQTTGYLSESDHQLSKGLLLPASSRVLGDGRSRDNTANATQTANAINEDAGPHGVPSRGLSIDDLLRMEDIGRAIITPDGRGLIYEKSPSYEDSPNVGALRVGDRRAQAKLMYADLTKDSASRPLFDQDPKGGYWLGSLSPDGMTLAIYSLIGETLRAGVVNLRTRIPTLFQFEPDTPQLQATPLWINSHELIYVSGPPRYDVTSMRGRGGLMNSVKTLWNSALIGDKPTATVVTSSADGLHEVRSFLPGMLLRVNAETGVSRQIAEGQYYDLTLSPDHRHLAALRNGGRIQPEQPSPGTIQVRRAGLVVLDLEGTAAPATPCSECDIYAHTLAWSHDGSRLTYIARPLTDVTQPAALMEYRPDSTGEYSYNLDNFEFACGTSADRLTPPTPIFSNGVLALGRQRTGETSALPVLDVCPNSQDKPPRLNQWYRLDRYRKPIPLDTPVAGGARILATDRHGAYILERGTLYQLNRDDHFQRILSRSDSGGSVRWRPARRSEYIHLQEQLELSTATGIAVESDTKIALLNTSHGTARIVQRPTPESEFLAISDAGQRAAFTIRSPQGTQLVVISNSDKVRTIDMVNGYMADVKSARETQLVYPGPNGEKLSSCLLSPAQGGRPVHKYPMVVSVYPNVSKGTCLHERFIDWPYALLASHGYAVLFPATPLPLTKSDRGPSAQITGLVLLAVDAAIATGDVDPDRLGVYGHSQGMREALQVVAETTRFKAALVSDGLSDFISAYGSYPLLFRMDDSTWLVPDAGRFESGGTNGLSARPWEDPKRYVLNSPVFYADSIHTPVLLVNGDLDEFGFDQSAEMFNALYRLRREAQYVTYWGEGHQIISPANLRDLWRRELDWYDEHLGVRR